MTLTFKKLLSWPIELISTKKMYFSGVFSFHEVKKI